MKTFTMVARHGLSKDAVTDFTLISPQYQTVKVGSEELKRMYSSKSIEISNMAPDGKGGWKSTNGAMDNYTFVNNATNMIEGVAKAVILDRAESEGKLVGYTVFTQNGTIVDMSIKDAVMLASNKLISNGKIRHTESGDIVAAIGGSYGLRTLEKLEHAPKGETSADIVFFGNAIIADKKSVKYFGAIVSCTSATEMTRLIDKLSKSNANVIAAVVAGGGGQQVRKTLAIKRMGVNSLYGVFELSALKDLVATKSKIKNNLGKIPVSSIKYRNDGSDGIEHESVVTLNNSWKIVSTNPCDDKSVDKAAKQYALRLIEAFGSISLN